MNECMNPPIFKHADSSILYLLCMSSTVLTVDSFVVWVSDSVRSVSAIVFAQSRGKFRFSVNSLLVPHWPKIHTHKHSLHHRAAAVSQQNAWKVWDPQRRSGVWLAAWDPGLGALDNSCVVERKKGLHSLSSAQFFFKPGIFFKQIQIFRKSLKTLPQRDNVSEINRSRYAFVRASWWVL